MEAVGDRRFGIQTAGFKASEKAGAHHYQGAAYSVILPLLQDLYSTFPKHHFYDIGCGKGRVLCVAAHCGFRHLTGIELDKDLLDAAEKNVKRMPNKSDDLQISLQHLSALEYSYENRPALYFLFNPFDAQTLGKFIDQVRMMNKQECCFVYLNPIYKTEFSTRGIKEETKIKTGFYTEALIYRLKAETEVHPSS